jgi:hypothetical protein
MSEDADGTSGANRTSAGDESMRGLVRSAVLPPEGIRAMRRGPVRLRLVPPSGSVDTEALLGEMREFGLGTEGLSVEVLESLVEVLPDLVTELLEDDALAGNFDRNPGAFRELLGSDLSDLATRVRADSARMQSVLRPPETGTTTRSPRRRTDRQLTATDPAVEQRVLALRHRIVDWSVAEETNLAQLRRNPEAVVRRLGAGEPEAVQRQLIALLTRADGEDDE